MTNKNVVGLALNCPGSLSANNKNIVLYVGLGYKLSSYKPLVNTSSYVGLCRFGLL